jgi:hypothetical protein
MYRADVLAGRLPRSVEALERLRLLPTTTRFHRTVCPAGTAARASWAREMVEAMGDADLVLLDPDNGLEGRDLTPKTVALEELKALRTGGRALLLYQHQTRRKGGASADIQAVVGRLQDSGFGAVQAIRFRPYSSRFYFLLDGFQELMQALGALASRWGDMVELH